MYRLMRNNGSHHMTLAVDILTLLCSSANSTGIK